MTVSTTSNDYAKKQLQNQIRNYKKLDKEKTYNRKRHKAVIENILDKLLGKDAFYFKLAY